MRQSVVVVCSALMFVGAQNVRAQAPPEDPPLPPPPSESAPPASEAPPPPAPAPAVIPPAPAPVVVDDSSYPMAYADRPLILPNSALEGSAELRYVDMGENVVDPPASLFLEPRARMGLPNAEVEVAASLLAHEGDTDSSLPPGVTVDRPLLSLLYAAGRYALDPNLALGAELGISGPTTDFPTFQPRAVIATRRHLARSSAVDVRFATGFDKYSSDGPPQIPTIFVASLRARVIAQPSPNFAAEVGATLSYFNSTGDDPQGFFSAAQSTTYAVRFIATPSRLLDIVFGAEFLSAEAITAFVGVAARRLP